MKIGLDIMGGDYAPHSTLHGALLASKQLSTDEKIVLIGDSNVAKEILQQNNAELSLFEFIHADDQIAMNEHATKAIRKKPNNSISVGFEALKNGEIDVFSSAGNSGAMLVGSMFSVGPIKGVIRPCITSVLPKENGSVGLILDVGVNADCKPDVLFQFAILGSLFAENVYGLKNPKVGLLNIGEEKGKGNLLTQAAFQLLEDNDDINFIGNVEGRDLFNEKADVIVCDGFTGNVVLKQAESFFTILAKRNLLDNYFKRFNYENYGGTPVLGVSGNVLIGHGISNDKAIKNMILLGKDLIHSNLTKKIKTAFK
ncbi:MAG: phosphate acyltransferase PlsX [Bacteroidota bacterium]|nr:phosphate acyltransferase PlsX [Crocinitomicaceae bacterium]MEC7005612.1 phosphate acyltransferase PlsX [Bacteroidota bacterium]MEC7062757.1 phosphate acyltransferase PlsX [Bacteroidota bacterium]MEC7083496.1 phosphate acyltransferase PlsX [Bacteroidota bacterium]MEC7127890.1 phosphate acyltransferase PlsX [Bacteroidota bacterium]